MSNLTAIAECEPQECWMCNKMYVHPSMGGPHVCPACDCGFNEDGTRWTYRQTIEAGERFKARAEREQALAKIEESFERLAEDPIALADYRAEAKSLEGTLMDGLEDLEDEWSRG